MLYLQRTRSGQRKWQPRYPPPMICFTCIFHVMVALYNLTQVIYNHFFHGICNKWHLACYILLGNSCSMLETIKNKKHIHWTKWNVLRPSCWTYNTIDLSTSINSMRYGPSWNKLSFSISPTIIRIVCTTRINYKTDPYTSLKNCS